MLQLESISFDELKPLVELGFGDDPELMETFQQIKTEFGVTVQRNLDNIKNSQSLFEFTYYKVMWDGQPIGFTVIDKEKGLLWSFGINISWRKKEIAMQWFNEVSKYLDHFVICVLWNQNFRAIRFLERNGMKIMNRNDETVTLMTA